MLIILYLEVMYCVMSMCKLDSFEFLFRDIEFKIMGDLLCSVNIFDVFY